MATPARRRTSTAVEPWDPFREFAAIEDRMARLLGDLMPTRPELRVLPSVAAEGWVPDMEIYETDDEVVAKAHVPGIDKDDLDVSVDEDSITIRGETKKSEETKSEGYFRSEISYGSFARTASLPDLVESGKAKAHLENGVLEVRIPRSAEEKAKTKKVEIS